MAVLKYVLQFYARGANTYPYYQGLIYARTNWSVNDGPIFLKGEGSEPITIETFESEGPIKPTSVLLNILNKRYYPEESYDYHTGGAGNANQMNGVRGGGSTIYTACDGRITKTDPSNFFVTTYNAPNGVTEELHTAAVISSSKASVLGDNGAGVYTTDSGATWTDITGLGTLDCFCSTVGYLSSTLVAIGGQDSGGAVYRSTDGGQSFAIVGSASGGSVNSMSLTTDTLFFTRQSGTKLFKITTFSGTPSAEIEIDLGDFETFDRIQSVYFRDGTNGCVVGQNTSITRIIKLWITDDGGSTWNQKQNLDPGTGPAPGDSSIQGVQMDSDGYVYLLQKTGKIYIWNGNSWDNDTIAIDSSASGVPSDLSEGRQKLFFDETNGYLHYATDSTGSSEQLRAYVSDYLREFKNFDFGDFVFVLQRATASYGGGSTQVIGADFHLDSEYGYSEDWSKPTGSFVSIRATDGFNIWKGIEYKTAGALRTGREKIISILIEALNLRNSTALFTERYRMYATYLNDNLGSDFAGTPTDATNPFVNGFVDAEYFLHEKYRPYTWWEVVEAILKAYDCILINPIFRTVSVTTGPVIMSSDRFYNTVDTDELDLLRYYSHTENFDTTVTEQYVRDINNAEGTFQGLYEVRTKKYQFVDAVIRNGRPLMLIPDGNFELEHWTSTSQLNNWTATSLTLSRSNNVDTDNYSEYSCGITTTSATLGAAGYIESVETSVPSGTRNIYLHFKYNCDVSSTSPGASIQINPTFYIQIKVGSYFLYDGVTNKPETAGTTELSALAWTETESWLTYSVPGVFMDTWRTEAWIISTDDWPDIRSGTFQVRFSEPDDNDYTMSNFRFDEIICFPVGDLLFREDIKIEAENTAISNGKRLDLGELHFYDLPKISFGDYSSATRGFSKVKFPTILNRTNGDTVGLTLDGVGHTFTYQSSPGASGSKDFDTDTRLIQEIYYISNNYFVSTDGDGSQPTVTLIPMLYDDTYDAADPALGDPTDWDNLATPYEALVEPTLTVWANHASISDNATPTTLADRTWHAVTQETTGSEDTELWKLRLERELARRGLLGQFLQGTYKIKAEDQDTFGSLMGLLTNTNLESTIGNYKPVSIRGNPRMGEWEIVMEKVHDETVTFSGGEIFEE